MRTVGCVFVALVLSASAACAQTPPEALTWMVLNEINGANFDRAEPFNRPPLVTALPEGVIRAVDVSHDGKPDWLVDYTDLAVRYCGTGGCLRTLYVSDGDDHVMAFDRQSHTLEVTSRGGETVIEARVHSLFCSLADDDCTFAWTWDPARKRLVERPGGGSGRPPGEEGTFSPIAAPEGGRPIGNGPPTKEAQTPR